MGPRLTMLVAGVRRFAVILAVLSALTAAVTLPWALLAGWRVDRSLAIGFDVVGIFFLVVGFFVGNRGPARLKGQESVPFYGPRRLRWATLTEREDALSDSAVFVAVGLVMIVIGIVIDSRYTLY